MKIVIDIDEYIIERANKNLPMYASIVDVIATAIANGTPLPEDGHEIDITYICDGKKCPECSIQCRHTTDISHAKNFKPVMSTDGETILSYEEDGYFDKLTKVLTKEILAKATLQFNQPTHEEYTERCNHTQSEGAYDE